MTYGFGQSCHKSSFSPEQQTQIQIKQLSIELDLNKKQEAKLAELYLQRAQENEKMKQNQGDFRVKVDSMSSDEKYKHVMDMLNKKEKFHHDVKEILTEAQYEKWNVIEHNHAKRMHKNIRST